MGTTNKDTLSYTCLTHFSLFIHFLQYINQSVWTLIVSRFGKEVIQPQVPLRLPCYDFTPVMNHTVVNAPRRLAIYFWYNPLPWCDGRCVQGPGTYSPQHSDLRLLAIPTSWSRVADSNPDLDVLCEIRSSSHSRFPLYTPL